MTRKLTEVFDLPDLEDLDTDLPAEFQPEPEASQEELEEAISNSDKINKALREVRGMNDHEAEMDEIAHQAMESFKQLMDLGHNVTDMAAAHVFTSATQMLKVALDAKDSKVNRKLKQIDLMMKKENLDLRKAKQAESDDEGFTEARVLDRNELMRIMKDSGNS